MILFEIEEMRKLKEELEHRSHIESKLASLTARKDELVPTVAMLRDKVNYEREDVEKLEHIGFLSLWYRIIGTKEEMLDKEKREALEAENRYLMADKELNDISEEIEKCEKALKHLDRCEERYEELRVKVSDSVHAQNSRFFPKLLETLERCHVYEARLKEVLEAIDAGEKVHRTAESAMDYITKYLNSRRRSHRGKMHDLFSDDMTSYEGLKMADNLIVSLRGQISYFNAELADVIDGETVEGVSEECKLAYVTSNKLLELTLFALDITGAVYAACDELKEIRSQAAKYLDMLYKKKERLEKVVSDMRSQIDAEMMSK